MPNIDEVAHLPAGISHWKYNRFDMYRVNPPLARLVTTCVAQRYANDYDWSRYTRDTGRRPEFSIGIDALNSKGIEISHRYRWPRLIAFTIFAIPGGLLIYYYTATTIGINSARITLALWSFSPDILAHGPTLVPDVATMSMGVLVAFLCWHFTCNATHLNAMKVGSALGLALLTKLTWVTSLVSLPVAFCIYRRLSRKECTQRKIHRLFANSFLFFLSAILVLNAGYFFEDTLYPASEFEFCSKAFGGSSADLLTHGNKFKNTLFADVPIPAPKNYLLGIDYLRYEVEQKKWSFLFSEWKHGSWPHYYIFTTLYKTPEPTLLGALIGLALLITGIRRKMVKPEVISMFLFLIVPAAVCFASVSLQGGFNHHHRYVLMIYPPMFALAAYIASPVGAELLCIRLPFFGPKKRSIAVPLAFTLVTLSAASALRVHPYYTSYFNTISGGPENGWRLLGFSNIDWGQDLLEVDKWIKEHPECRPLRFELDYFDVNGELFDLPPASPPRLPTGASYVDALPEETEWWIISVKQLYNLPGYPGLEYLQQLEPTDRIAYAYHVYKMPGKNKNTQNAN